MKFSDIAFYIGTLLFVLGNFFFMVAMALLAIHHGYLVF